MIAADIHCAFCLDSGLVASGSETPWPTVLADANLDLDREQGLVVPLICPHCGGAAPDGNFADGYVAGHKAALAAARKAGELLGTAAAP